MVRLRIGNQKVPGSNLGRGEIFFPLFFALFPLIFEGIIFISVILLSFLVENLNNLIGVLNRDL